MRRNPARNALAFALLLLGAAGAALLPAAGCGGGGATGGGGGANTTVLHPGGAPLPGEDACTVTEVTDISIGPYMHVPPCTPVTYATNPPSGGSHWPIWAAYRKYTAPVPHEMLVHDLEHGAIVLLYRCADGCPDVIAALDQVYGSITDASCAGPPSGPSARMILAPDPTLEAPIAAAAWGATYTATCIDVPSLRAFAKDHYGHGPEDLCGDGLDVSAGTPCMYDGGPDANSAPDGDAPDAGADAEGAADGDVPDAAGDASSGG